METTVQTKTGRYYKPANCNVPVPRAVRFRMTGALWVVTGYLGDLTLTAPVRLRAAVMKLRRTVAEAPKAAMAKIGAGISCAGAFLHGQTSSGLRTRLALKAAVGLSAMLMLALVPANPAFDFAFFSDGSDAEVKAETSFVAETAPVSGEQPAEIAVYENLYGLPPALAEPPALAAAAEVKAEDVEALVYPSAVAVYEENMEMELNSTAAAADSEAEPLSVSGDGAELLSILENLLMERSGLTEDMVRFVLEVIGGYEPDNEISVPTPEPEQEAEIVLSERVALSAGAGAGAGSGAGAGTGAEPAIRYEHYESVDPALILETIPYSTVYIINAALYQGDTRVVVAGRDGYVFAAGADEIHADEAGAYSEVSVIEPVTEVIAVGSAPKPIASDGSYSWPAEGIITSWFGPRATSFGSTNHKGIDICAGYGQPIYAADGGEVIFSGGDGGFGYVVRIRHENGDVTVYAHCSSLLAKAGEIVSRGQKIALMGSTGTASGVHLHFELIVEGENVDPLKYLS